MVGWRENLGPTKPVIEDDKLYGRGSADDGYSIFAAVLIIKACQALGLPHPRCVITIEADEESESRDYHTIMINLKKGLELPLLWYAIFSE